MSGLLLAVIIRKYDLKIDKPRGRIELERVRGGSKRCRFLSDELLLPGELNGRSAAPHPPPPPETPAPVD